MYNYPELVSRIRDEVPDTDFLVSDPREFMFEYDCGHSEKIRTRNFVWQHKRCSECKRDELSKRLDFLLELREKAEKRKIRANTKPVKKKKTHCKTYYMFKRSRPKHVEVVCSKCDKQFTIQTSSYLRNIKKHNMRYICNICASSKGIRLSEKLKSPEFAHVLWSDKNECARLLSPFYQADAPAAVRYPRGTGTGAPVSDDLETVAIGKGVIRRQGQKTAILAFGSMVQPAMQAAESLNATVADMRFVKPLDETLILELAQTHDRIVCIEENSICGGAGGAVLECLAQHGVVKPVLPIGIPDTVTDHGDPALLLDKLGLSAEKIRERIANWQEAV